MMGTVKRDLTGIVRNFSSALINNDQIPYFEFALTLPLEGSPHEYPLEAVLYVDLGQANAQSIVSVVTSAWAEKHHPIDVFLIKSTPQKMLVARVEKAAKHKK
jgi:hypothetical protein